MTPAKKSRRSRKSPIKVEVDGAVLRCNKATGMAYLMLPDPERGGGKVRHYVGRYHAKGDDDRSLLPETQERARVYLAEWRAARTKVSKAGHTGDTTVRQLVAAFLADRGTFARPTEINNFERATDVLLDLYGEIPAGEFSPLKLIAVRENMIRSKRLSRNTLNNRIDRIKAMFRWGIAREIVPALVCEGLRAVDNISHAANKKEKRLRESRIVRPVPEAHVNAVLPLLTPPVRAIIELMRHTGARCGEITQMRPCDVDRSSTPWVFTPQTHKTQDRGRERTIPLGPKARAVLAPWLLRGSKDVCFSPREAEAARQAARFATRKTPIGKGHRPGYSLRTRQNREPIRAPGEMYSTSTVRRAIQRAAKLAGVPSWSPNQLRHLAATELRRRLGIEAARVVLGHTSASTTEIYAEVDRQAARAAMEDAG